MDNIQWVNQLPPTKRGFSDKRGEGPVQQLIKELKKNPNNWALFYVLDEGKKFTSCNQYKTRYRGTEWAIRTIDGKVHVYVRWVGESQ